MHCQKLYRCESLGNSLVWSAAKSSPKLLTFCPIKSYLFIFFTKGSIQIIIFNLLACGGTCWRFPKCLYFLLSRLKTLIVLFVLDFTNSKDREKAITLFRNNSPTKHSYSSKEFGDK